MFFFMSQVPFEHVGPQPIQSSESPCLVAAVLRVVEQLRVGGAVGAAVLVVPGHDVLPEVDPVSRRLIHYNYYIYIYTHICSRLI